ncbi:tripartite motif-containing protein 49D-like [Pipistrellus kuhlii]|uniref:tripartite motif-containing protein 49D-like n=1 Tax=Pipistrellus kuhlii TaxID=59472 RepID=UPI00174F108D|nr:tripartite motif-containing protein 49D-like [Pipistrellus kuhlii]
MDRILQVFQNDLTCSICRNCFVDPITTDCGHSFCRTCFYLSWPNRSGLTHCSECQKEIQQRDFHTNVILKEMVLIVTQGSLWHSLWSTENRCRIHMEAKQIFCEEQRSLLCLHCSTSQEHGAHRHCSIGKAAEQHREKLLKTMCSVWEKCRENDRNLNVETVTTRSWKIYVTSQQEAIRAAYDELAPTEPLKKHHHLERLQREGKKIFEQLRDSEASMENKRELLRVMYAELREMCHKPDVQLLLDFGDILHKSEAVCEYMPQPVKAELTAVTIPGMMARFNHLQRNINVYHGRALNHEFLQGDLISLNIGWGVLSTPFNFSRSDCFFYLGNSIFTYGQHYWELEVGDTWNWALGVCCDDWNIY